MPLKRILNGGFDRKLLGPSEPWPLADFRGKEKPFEIYDAIDLVARVVSPAGTA